MILEYLMQDESGKDFVTSYEPEDVDKQLFSVENGSCWWVRFSMEGENEKTASRLSEIDEYVRTHCRVTTLDDGCSAYYNNRLFPLISNFEHKLRKLLYLASAINHDEQATKNIVDLETMTFGQLFSMLLIDETFMQEVKKEIKQRNKDGFSKADILSYIDSVNENTLWKQLLGENSVPTLQNRFHDVKSYRDDVMHAHHVNSSKYNEIQSLFDLINRELDDAVNGIQGDEYIVKRNISFNKTLSDAIASSDWYAEVVEASKRMLDEITMNNNILMSSADIAGYQSTLSELVASGFSSSAALKESLSNVSSLASSIKANQALAGINWQTEYVKGISDAIAEAQYASQQYKDMLSSISALRANLPFTSVQGFNTIRDSDNIENKSTVDKEET